MDNYFIAVIVWLAFIFTSRSITNNANKALDQEKKAALVDLFSENKYFFLGSVIAMLVLFYLCIKNNWLNYLFAFVLYLIVMILLSCINSYLAAISRCRNSVCCYCRSGII